MSNETLDHSSVLLNALPIDALRAQRMAKIKLLAIVFFCALPIILASVFYSMGWGSAKKMVGELVAKPLPAVVWTNEQRQPVDFAVMRQWKLLMVTSSAECLEACKQQAFWLKQLHLAQGEAQKRISRWWLVQQDSMAVSPTPSPIVIDDKFLGRLSGASLTASQTQLFYQTLAGPHSDISANFYLIDPHNNLVMRYNTQMDRTQVMREIAKILKNNERIG